MDTLGVQLSPSHYRAGSGLSPFRFRPCRAHYGNEHPPGAREGVRECQNSMCHSDKVAHYFVGIPRSEREPADIGSKIEGDCHTSDIGLLFAMTSFIYYVLFDETFP